MYSVVVKRERDDAPADVSREPIAAPERERAALTRIGDALGPKRPGAARLRGPRGEEMLLPQSLYAVLVQAVKQLMAGRAISIVPVMTALTTQQAADMVNVSRPFLVKLLEDGTIPFHKAGTHRRVYLKDLLSYKRRRDARARAALHRLVDDAQDLGIYDE
jgi:excisionase family DNA binding protein